MQHIQCTKWMYCIVLNIRLMTQIMQEWLYIHCPLTLS